MNALALVVDLAIALTLAEALWLALRRHGRDGSDGRAGRAGRGGRAARDALVNVSAGLALMLALRGVVHGAPPAATVAWLALAGAAHAVDMAQRLRRTKGSER